jgi:hypothetical protein
MRDLSKECMVATSALIDFEDGSVSFCIPRGATLADIAENVERIGKWHCGHALSIAVGFSAANRRSPGRDRTPPLISFAISGRNQPGLPVRFKRSAQLHRVA